MNVAAIGDPTYTSLGLSGRAHILVFLITIGGGVFVLRLLRQRQMRGKYTLLLVCIYFSYELSRLELRTRILAEELAIVRGERETTTQ